MLPGLPLVLAAAVPVRAHAQDAALLTAEPVTVITVVSLAVGCALLAAAEAAFLLPRRLKLDTTEPPVTRRQKAVHALAADHGPLLIAILIAHVSLCVSFAVLATRLVSDSLALYSPWPPAPRLALAIATATIVLVVFCEALPRLLAARRRETAAQILALPLQGLLWVLKPIARLLIRFTELLFRLMRLGEVKAAPFLTDEELKTAMTAHEVRAVIEEQEGQMIQGILNFSDAVLREILVPRPDIIAVACDATVRDVLDLYRQHGLSRMPVIEEDLDHIIGVVVVKDLLPHAVKENWDRPVSGIMRPPRFVPETMTALAFLRDAQRVQMHLAIVVDEYGGTAGLVTLEDAMEQVVGEIPDIDEARESVEHLGEGRYRIDGAVSLDDLTDVIGIPVNDGGHETVGGLLMDLTNKIPEQGDQSEYNGARFTVEEVDGKRAATLTVEVLEPPAAKEQAG